MANVEITGGRILLEVDGVLQEGYFNQVYKAQAAAINLAMQLNKDVKIILPPQVVKYVPDFVEPPITVGDYIIMDNEEAILVGDWQDSGVAGYIGANAVYTAAIDSSAEFVLAIAEAGLYEIDVHITKSNLRTTQAHYSINDVEVTLDQQQIGGWVTLGETALSADTSLFVTKLTSGGSLVVDAIRYRLIGELPEGGETGGETGTTIKTVLIKWEQATNVDGELITPIKYMLRITDVDDNLVSTIDVDGNLLETTQQLEVGPYTVEVSAVNSAGQSEWSDKLQMTVA